MMMAAALGPLAGGDPQRYLALVTVMTLIVGLIYIFMGIVRLGFIASFLSLPILVGFLNGIALLIIVGQLEKLFGYSVEASDFFPKLMEHLDKIHTAHPRRWRRRSSASRCPRPGCWRPGRTRRSARASRPCRGPSRTGDCDPPRSRPAPC